MPAALSCGLWLSDWGGLVGFSARTVSLSFRFPLLSAAGLARLWGQACLLDWGGLVGFSARTVPLVFAFRALGCGFWRVFGDGPVCWTGVSRRVFCPERPRGFSFSALWAAGFGCRTGVARWVFCPDRPPWVFASTSVSFFFASCFLGARHRVGHSRACAGAGCPEPGTRRRYFGGPVGLVAASRLSTMRRGLGGLGRGGLLLRTRSPGWRRSPGRRAGIGLRVDAPRRSLALICGRALTYR